MLASTYLTFRCAEHFSRRLDDLSISFLRFVSLLEICISYCKILRLAGLCTASSTFTTHTECLMGFWVEGEWVSGWVGGEGEKVSEKSRYLFSLSLSLSSQHGLDPVLKKTHTTHTQPTFPMGEPSPRPILTRQIHHNRPPQEILQKHVRPMRAEMEARISQWENGYWRLPPAWANERRARGGEGPMGGPEISWCCGGALLTDCLCW